MKVRHLKEAVEELVGTNAIELDDEVQFALVLIMKKAVEKEKRDKNGKKISINTTNK